MEEKYIKFYKTFHKKFENDKNLIHCFELLCNSGVKETLGYNMCTIFLSVCVFWCDNF